MSTWHLDLPLHDSTVRPLSLRRQTGRAHI